MLKPRMVLGLMGLLMASVSCGQWTDEEKKAIQDFWNSPGRLTANATTNYVPRLTVDGSKWLWEYNRKLGKGKVAPTQNPTASNAQQAAWEKWIEAKVAWDRYNATVEAAKKNILALPKGKIPQDPGAVPEDLVALNGTPPCFANAVQPTAFTIHFDDVDLTYQDNVDMRPRYAYYRFPEGVMSAGTRMKNLPPEEIDRLLEQAGISPTESRVFKAVSLLEGGFDSINTYDTGFVSVGFIQFASLAEGGHSLGVTLQQLKQDDPVAFDQYFRQFGIDVDQNARLTALCMDDLSVKEGPDANAQIIKDKRLIAVFQRSGRFAPYRIAQLKVAKKLYWPLNEVATLGKNDLILTGPISQLLKSEAGAAVVVDRKVNTGKIGPLNEIIQAIAEAKGLKTLEEVAQYEALIIECLWYRFDPTKDETLSKPPACEMIPQVLAKYGRSHK